MSEHGHCADYLAQFSDYIDHDLTPDLCAQIEEHLKECTNCTIVVNTMRRTIELYHEDPDDAALPEGVRQRLFARLDLTSDREKA